MKIGRFFFIGICFVTLFMEVLFYFAGFPWLHSQALNDAERYAKENFPFKVVCAKSAFYFEDQAYVVDCHAENAPDNAFEIVWDSNLSNMKDSYFVSVWEQELQNRYEELFSNIVIHLDYFRDFNSYQQYNYFASIPSIFEGNFSPGLSLTLRIECNAKKEIDNELKILLDQVYWDFKNSNLQVELNSNLYLIDELPQVIGE